MTPRISEYAARVDEATPAERDRHIDLLRGSAIIAVVVGHWLVASVVRRDDGSLDGVSVLTVADWTHWATWLFQVMPVFFLVGGYANATSWERHEARGATWVAWVHRRAVRLLAPTAAFVGFGVGAVVVAHLAGVDPVMIDLAGWVAGIVLWFLAVYIVVTALTPATHRLHRRFGLAATLVLGLAVAVGDVARVLTGDPAWSGANFVLGWALIHTLGFWWRDGVLPTGAGAPLLFAAAAATVLAALVIAGPWPVAMVDVPGATVQNSSPPSLALLALTLVQLGLALAVADTARRWLRRPLPWTVVATVNRVVLTIFLWHMVAVVLGAVALYGSGLMAEPEPLSSAWFAWRPVWLGALALITAALVAVFAPLEQRAARPVRARADRPRRAAALAGAGIVLACGGLVGLTLGGLAGQGPLGMPVVGLSAVTAGTVMTFLAGRFAGPVDP
ncbi:MAG TPA: acyltransferase [Euzebyales bacterium]|nr:acyltransferase [Euzebyales bacterium]